LIILVEWLVLLNKNDQKNRQIWIFRSNLSILKQPPNTGTS